MKKVLGFMCGLALSATGFLFAGFHSIQEARALDPCPSGTNWRCVAGNCDPNPCGDPGGPYHRSCVDLGSTCLMGAQCQWNTGAC